MTEDAAPSTYGSILFGPTDDDSISLLKKIEDAYKDESGRLLLSRTAVSELGERLWADYQDFATRDLGEYDITYLFVDGIAERIRPGQRREPVLAAWGFTTEGKKVLLPLMAGSKEDAETVSAFFQDMRARGLAIRCWLSPMGRRGPAKRSCTGRGDCSPSSLKRRKLRND